MRWPDFFIVGAAKAGTTSLYAYMRQHPEVFMPDLKEPHFFSGVCPTDDQSDYVRCITDEGEYLSLFLPGKDYKRIGEASPSYLWHPEAAARIHAVNPKARIIILLRDPIERAYSHYLMDVRRGRQTLPFLEAIRMDYNRSETGWGVSHLYVELGFYDEQVARYVRCFGPDNVLVIQFESLTKDPIATTRQALNFVGVNPAMQDFDVTRQVHNSYAAPRGRLTTEVMQSPLLRTITRELFPRSFRQRIARSILQRRRRKPQIPPEAVEYLLKIYNSKAPQQW